MNLQFLGATRQVTGSRYCLSADGAKVLVDCGMFQERAYLDRNWEPSAIEPSSLDAVLLTHAHLDHCGLVPRLVQQGFRGPIYATAASADLVEIILRDSAHIQVEDVEYKKRRHRKEKRRSKHPEVPLYTPKDVDRALKMVEPVRYREPVKINDRMTATFHDAGHILGSAIVEINAAGDGHQRRVLFSGDLGKWNTPIVRDPTTFDSADYVVCESTYGDRDRKQVGDVEGQLGDVIGQALRAGGNVVIPVFAVERSQEVMYHISRLVREDRIPDVPIFLDSPMAADVTEVFRRHRDCFDDEAWNLIVSGEPPLRFPGLVLSRSVEQSRKINELTQPAIIMATSGMCTAGRIKFHLRRNIQRPESTILFVGYQVPGTLGHQIVNGRPRVRIHGRDWRVKARIERIEGFSGHADRGGLLQWLGGFQDPPRHLFVTHGDEEASQALAQTVQNEMGWQVTVPEFGQRITLD